MKKIFTFVGMKTVLILLIILSFVIFFNTFKFYNDYLEIVLMIILNMWLIVPVVILILERAKEREPKLKISFELIRSSLLCLVFRNLGSNELEVLSVTFDESFINQLNKKDMENLKSMQDTEILISNKQRWVLNLGITVFEIIGKYKNKTLKLNYSYRKVGCQKIFKDNLEINFNNYGHFMLYVSELDEINNTLKEISKKINDNTEEQTKLVKTTRLLSAYVENQVVSTTDEK